MPIPPSPLPSFDMAAAALEAAFWGCLIWMLARSGFMGLYSGKDGDSLSGGQSL